MEIIKRTALAVLFILMLFASLDIILLNLYFNVVIDLPSWFVWSGLLAAYDLYFFPTTLLIATIFVGAHLFKKPDVETNIKIDDEVILLNPLRRNLKMNDKGVDSNA